MCSSDLVALDQRPVEIDEDRAVCLAYARVQETVSRSEPKRRFLPLSLAILRTYGFRRVESASSSG